VEMPEYHAAGASKVIRRECFERIGGFVVEKSWDTVDEIRAQVNGWDTGHFPDIQFYHLKNEGSGIGQLRTAAMLGEVSYLTGWSKAFFLAKAIRRLVTGRPFVLGSVMMMCGYWKALLLRKQPLVSDEEARHYRRLLAARLGFIEGKN
jgi:biofilm PGA synthesis N-glycosyltransferase PgaC